MAPMRIYNLFPTLAGRFSNWTPHLARAADLGFDWLFVNPIQPPGMSGSLYSIRDYFAINPKLLDPSPPAPPPETQLRAALDTARALGLRTMVDLVINHCAVDAPLVREHPEWFAWHNGEVAHPSCEHEGNRIVWGDLAKFDYDRTPDRAGLEDFVARVAEHLAGWGFDGFRCDAAYLLPPDVWRRLIVRVRARFPRAVFVAETLGCTADQTLTTARLGFDAVFNSGKWWDFQSPWLMEQYDLIREHTRSVGFPESHDTPRLAEELHGDAWALKQRYLFAALFSAGVMMPVGFEYGFRRRLHVVDTVPEHWEESRTDLTEFIRRTNRVKAAHGVFQEEGPTHVVPWGQPNILVLWKGSVRTGEEALLILNKDPWAWQRFEAASLRPLVQSGAPLKCVSPENPLEHVPEPFVYDLRPGEGIVLVARR